MPVCGGSHEEEAGRDRGGAGHRVTLRVQDVERPAGDIIAPDAPLAELMHACWASFIKTGEPKCGATAWPAYTPAADHLMEFGLESGVRTGIKKAEFKTQEMVGLPGLKLGK